MSQFIEGLKAPGFRRSNRRQSLITWVLAGAGLFIATAQAAPGPGMCPTQTYKYECILESEDFVVYDLEYDGCIKTRPAWYECKQKINSADFLGGTYSAFESVFEEVPKYSGNGGWNGGEAVWLQAFNVQTPKLEKPIFSESFGMTPGVWQFVKSLSQCQVVVSSTGLPEPVTQQCEAIPRIIPARPERDRCGVSQTQGNPVKLATLKKTEAQTCLTQNLPGSDITFNMKYAAPRVLTLASGQSARPSWTHNFDRKLFSFFEPIPNAGPNNPKFMVIRRLQMGDGEAYDFYQSGAGSAGFPYSFISANGAGFGKLEHSLTTNEFIYTYPSGDQDIFDGSGRLIRVAELNGSYLTLTRNGTSQLDITSWPSNRTTRVTYADQGSGNGLLTVTDLNPPSGTPTRQATMTYAAGQMTKYVDIAGRVAQYRYDGTGRMTQHYNALNNPDTLGAAAKFTQIDYACPTCNEVSYELLPNGTRLDFTPVTGQPWTLEVRETGNDGAVRIYRYAFDNRQLMTRQYVVNSTSKYSEFEYDSYGGYLINSWDTERRRTSYYYDGSGFLARKRVYRDASTYDETSISNNRYGQTTKITEPSGTITNMTFDAKGWLTSLERVGAGLTQTTTMQYAPVTINGQSVQIGLPTSVTLPDGTVNSQSYDARGYPSVSTFDAGGLNITESTVYDGRGFLTASVDRRGIRSVYEYSNSAAAGQFGNLGIPTAVIYDTQGVDGQAARAIRTEAYLDAMLNPVRVVEDAGSGRINATTLINYAMVGSEGVYAPTQMTDAENRINRMEYDGLGQLSKLLQVGARSGINTSLTTCAGSTESRLSSTDRVTRFCYTPEGWALKTILDDGRVTDQMGYGGFSDGLPRTVTDARGVRSEYQYDGKGRLSKVIEGAIAISENAVNYPVVGSEYSFSYDGNDRVLSVLAKLASGNRTLVSNQYDGLGRLLTRTDGAGNQSTFDYDPLRNFLLASTVGANSAAQQVTSMASYDRLGRVLSTRTDPNGKNLTTSYSYAMSGDRWIANAITNPNGNTTRYRYTSLGTLLETTDALGSTWKYTTNNLGDLTVIDVPGMGADVNYAVNKIGQTLSLTRNGQSESWSYNTDGSIKRFTQFSGQTVDQSYDPVGRLIKVDYSGTNSDVAGARSDIDAISYWANDLVRSVTSKPNGSAQETSNYTYDAANRLIGSTRGGRTVGYRYNLDDTLSQISYWTRGTVDFGYGGNSQNNGLVRSLQAWGATSSYAYRSTNALASITRPSGNGVNSVFDYDSAMRMTSVNHTSGTSVRSRFDYSFDNNGNRTKIVESFGALGSTAAQSSEQRFAYDPLNRLIRAEYGLISGSAKREENYQYDAVGNRINVQQTSLFNSSDLNQDGTPDIAWRLFDNSTGKNSAWLMKGAKGDQLDRGLFTQDVSDANWSYVTGDINGDAKGEFVWRNKDTGENVFWNMGGADNLVFQSGSSLLFTNGANANVSDSGWVQEAVADVNRDGKGDVIWRNYSTGENAIWYMGAGSNGQQLTGSVFIESVLDLNMRLDAVADFNNDGFVDFAWHNSGNGTGAGLITIWYMGGDGTKRISSAVIKDLSGNPMIISTANTGYRLRGAGDANKDGNADLYWYSPISNQVAIWYLSDNGETLSEGVFVATQPSGQLWNIAKGSSYHRVSAQNALSYDASDRITGAGFSYDSNGNLLSTPIMMGATTTTYSYTAANKLLRTVKDGITTEYQYDGNGNLIRQIRSGVTTDYVLDENAGLPNVIGEITGTTETLYAFGPEGLHAQQKFVSGVAQTLEYTYSDGLSSIKSIIGASGDVRKAMSFDAWGQSRMNNGTASSTFGFTGQHSMGDGTINLRARSYVSALGQFLQRDSFAGFSDRTQSLNRYAYTEGNPTNWVDPSGFASVGHGLANVIGGGLGVLGGVGTVGASGAVTAGSGLTLTPATAPAAALGIAQTGTGIAQLGYGLKEMWHGLRGEADAMQDAANEGDKWGLAGGLTGAIAGFRVGYQGYKMANANALRGGQLRRASQRAAEEIGKWKEAIKHLPKGAVRARDAISRNIAYAGEQMSRINKELDAIGADALISKGRALWLSGSSALLGALGQFGGAFGGDFFPNVVGPTLKIPNLQGIWKDPSECSAVYPYNHPR